MTIRGLLIIFGSSLVVSLAHADEAIYRYEGDVVPYDPSAGWLDGLCEPPCSESLEDGHFVLRWTEANDHAFYIYVVTRSGEERPPSLWVEWRFRSNHPIPTHSFGCDAVFIVDYAAVHRLLNTYGNAAVSASGAHYALGLSIDEFHTYRFESPDGARYWFSVDGAVFWAGEKDGANDSDYLEFGGKGGCLGDQIPNMVNEWDHVRFGTISYGEQLVSSDPPQGFVDAREHAPLDRFTVTFDSANYVYIDEIGVNVTSGVRPVVIQTRRLDNGDPETVEIVLDRPIPFDASTKFLFNDGVTTNRVIFTFAPGDTDGDGDADLRDFATFQTCFGHDPITGPCLALDSITDGTVDLSDYAEFEASLRGP